MRQVLAPDDIVISDVGAHKMWIARHYQCHQANTCLIPNGFCSMGFALPGAIAAALEEKVWPLIEAGKIKPVIHAEFPLAEAEKAHEMMESSTRIGKIILTT